MVDFNQIAKKWQSEWEKEKIFHVESDKRKKFYIAIVYPYMSGLLHLGHLFTYTFSEIMLRYKKMQNYNSLAKFGFHCTGTPIVAAALRVKEKEPSQLESLRKMGIPEKELQKFKDPLYWIDYFPKETLKDAKAMGFAIDERYAFKTTYLNKSYDAFIRWQFNKLKEKGLVKKGKHPVMWCPKENVPVGDHDRAEGEGETPQEFLLFKHKLDDGKFVISATLRHDTVLGITNLFVHPDIEYCEAKVNNETWIIGQKAAERLINQDFNVKIIKKIKGSELISKKTTEFDGKRILILPATFLDPDFGTALVHSVPAESADDLIALWDLQKNKELCKKYHLDIEEVKKIKPIPILNTPEYGSIAAEAMLKKYNITSQNQRDKLEAIRKELYTLSHYTATFNELYKNAFSVNLEGKKVQEGKEIIKKELIDKNFAVVYYEPTGKVVCRCLSECVVKIVEDQWFIEYNDKEWKKLAYQCLKQMQLYPEQLRKQFEYVIDWLHHWACTREYGLGTKLPWNQKWVIESLSDSTMQMAYGTISKYLEHPKEYNFSIDKLNDEFFDYVFLGKGNIAQIEKTTTVPKKMIETMRKDFLYWYPFDFRNSAKDLVQNHLAFCIFNHVALFENKHWPRAFAINGRIMVNNEKMSKSKGNFYTMRELYEKHGPDIVRITAANAGEGIDDANYDMAFLDVAKKKLTELNAFINDHHNKGRSTKLHIDNWFESSIHESVKKTTDAMENILFKSALQYGFLDMQRNVKWYLKRTNNDPNKELIKLFIETQLKLLTVFTPHFCEECWHLIGKKTFISLELWPKANEKMINVKLNDGEELIVNTMYDIREVLKLANIEKPKKIQLFVSAAWKYELFKKVHSLIDTKNQNEIIKEIMNDQYLKKYGQDIMKFLPKMLQTRKIPLAHLSQKEELNVLKEAVDFMKKEFNCEIEIFEAEKTNEQKAKMAVPGKTAILVN